MTYMICGNRVNIHYRVNYGFVCIFEREKLCLKSCDTCIIQKSVTYARALH